MGPDAGYVDYWARSCGLHCACKDIGCPDNRIIVQRRHGRDGVKVEIRERADPENSGIVDQDIGCAKSLPRSEEHTSELQSLMRISYAVFCLKKKTTTKISMIMSHSYIYTLNIEIIFN